MGRGTLLSHTRTGKLPNAIHLRIPLCNPPHFSFTSLERLSLLESFESGVWTEPQWPITVLRCSVNLTFGDGNHPLEIKWESDRRSSYRGGVWAGVCSRLTGSPNHLSPSGGLYQQASTGVGVPPSVCPVHNAAWCRPKRLENAGAAWVLRVVGGDIL